MKLTSANIRNKSLSYSEDNGVGESGRLPSKVSCVADLSWPRDVEVPSAGGKLSPVFVFSVIFGLKELNMARHEL